MEGIKLYAGLDVHKEFIVGTIKDEKGNLVRFQRVTTNEDGAKQLFYGLNNVNAVFEAGRNWTYINSLIKPFCNEVIMAHPLKVKAIASARIKTDSIDSNILSDLLRADLIPQSNMPSQNIVDLREILRHRNFMVQMTTQLKNKCHAILAREGKSFSTPWGIRSKSRMSKIMTNSIYQRELNDIIEQIDFLKKKIDIVNEDIKKKEMDYPEVDLLKSIPGISTYSALLILAEIDNISRFPSPNKLAAYAGLVPSTYQSGNSCYQGKITKQGSKALRWILIQCTKTSIKKKHRLQTFYLRIKQKKGGQKATVATARKMLTTIWHLLVKNEYYIP